MTIQSIRNSISQENKLSSISDKYDLVVFEIAVLSKKGDVEKQKVNITRLILLDGLH